MTTRKYHRLIITAFVLFTLDQIIDNDFKRGLGTAGVRFAGATPITEPLGDLDDRDDINDRAVSVSDVVQSDFGSSTDDMGSIIEPTSELAHMVSKRSEIVKAGKWPSVGWLVCLSIHIHSLYIYARSREVFLTDNYFNFLS